MPLEKGTSDKTVSDNISEMMHKWESTGKIGTSTPESKEKAQAQATRIALEEAGKSKFSLTGPPQEISTVPPERKPDEPHIPFLIGTDAGPAAAPLVPPGSASGLPLGNPATFFGPPRLGARPAETVAAFNDGLSDEERGLAERYAAEQFEDTDG